MNIVFYKDLKNQIISVDKDVHNIFHFVSAESFVTIRKLYNEYEEYNYYVSFWGKSYFDFLNKQMKSFILVECISDVIVYYPQKFYGYVSGGEKVYLQSIFPSVPWSDMSPEEAGGHQGALPS